LKDESGIEFDLFDFRFYFFDDETVFKRYKTDPDVIIAKEKVFEMVEDIYIPNKQSIIGKQKYKAALFVPSGKRKTSFSTLQVED